MAVIGAFELVQPVASGGAGTVWSAWHRATGDRVAVKVLGAELAHDELFVRSFRNEVRAAARLDHPHVIRVLDHGRISRAQSADDPRLPMSAPWLAMDWVDGGRLRDSGIESWDQLGDLAVALLSALAHAHARGVLHRDLKPANVLLAGPDDAVPGPRLADFAISARRTQGPATVLHLGTPEYLPPERLRDTWWEEGPASDLYALGLVLWRMATASLPHGGATVDEIVAERLANRLVDFQPRFPVPDGLADWLRYLLAPSVRARPRSAAAAARALLAVTPWPEPRLRARTEWELRLLDAQATGGGGRAPIPRTWRLAAAVESRPPRTDRLQPRRLELRPLPTVDRQDERDRLWAMLRDVRTAGAPRLAVLHGPSGFGKTHLATWLSEAADEIGVAEVLRARHDPVSGPQHGLGPMFARWLRVLGMPHDRALPAIQARLDQHGVDVTDVALSLAELVRSDRSDAPGMRFQHPQERFALMRGVLEGLAEDAAVVLVLDDLQWGTEARAWVRELLWADGADALPLVIVATWATDVGPPTADQELRSLLGLRGVADLAVGALDTEDLRALLRDQLGLADDLAARVEDRAAGNPSYVLQLVETWAQRGLLERGERGWRLAEGAEVSLPRGARAVWLGRIEPLLADLPATAGEALELAAFLGLHVAIPEWEEVCRSLGIRPPQRLVEALADIGLIRVDALDTWSFAHAMLRDALLERARSDDRAMRHHRACARVVASSGRLGREARLGRHLLAGGDPVAAVAPLAASAEQAMDAGEFARAEVLLTERDQALQAAGLDPSDPRWGDGWLLWCRMLRVTGREEGVEDLARRTVEAGRRHGWGPELVRGLVFLGRAALRRGDVDEAWSQVTQAEALVDEFDDRRLAAEVLRAEGLVLIRRGELDLAAACFGRALQLLQDGEDPLRRAGILLDLSYVARQRGDCVEAERQALAALDHFRGAGSRWGVANAMNLLGEVARQRGEHQQAVAHYRQAVDRGQGVSRSQTLVPRLNLALALVEAGQPQEARERLLRVLADFGGASRPDLLSTAHAGLAAAAADLGDWQALVHDVAMVEQELGRGRYIDRDLGTLLERAGRAAQAQGHTGVARAALRIARDQWRALGVADALTRVEAMLATGSDGAEE